jgi:hypothetical protein
MSKKNNLYLGKAGQLSAMSSFLARGWNVATPEVDVGDDLFVIEDKKGIFFRVQVKTAQATERNNGYSAQFNIPLNQLLQSIDPEIFYVLVVFKDNESLSKIVIRRDWLSTIFRDKNIGSIHENSLMLYFSFQDTKVMCSSIDFTYYLNNFNDFPIIEH